MSEMITITAEDGHKLQTYRVQPDAQSNRALVVIQEIFGVNDHIKSVTDRFAKAGFHGSAPALFDRVEPGIELGYTPDDVTLGRAEREKVPLKHAQMDVAAAIKALVDEGVQVGVVGYCWGGSLAWVAATRIAGVACAVGYYGGMVPELRHEEPNCPVMLHFGEDDQSIPIEGVNQFIEARPDVPVHIYPAGHGFSCDARGSYHAPSAALALERTMAFLNEHMPG